MVTNTQYKEEELLRKVDEAMEKWKAFKEQFNLKS